MNDLDKKVISGITLREYREKVHVDSPPPNARGVGMQSKRKNLNNSSKIRWKETVTPEQRAIFLEEQALKEEMRNNAVRQKSEALELERLEGGIKHD